jgi:hypothetical protein
MLDVKPPPGGLILIVLPTLCFISEAQLYHPRILWWSWGMVERLEIPDDVGQVIICTLLLAERHQKTIERVARSRGISEVIRVSSSEKIVAWADKVPVNGVGKERLMEQDASGVKPGKPILVVGADTTAFDEVTRRDPRVRHWSAGDIRDGVSIPGDTEKIVSCPHAIGRKKAMFLERVIREARSAGRHIKSWEVPHQGRLREVLVSELGHVAEADGNGSGNGTGIRDVVPPVTADFGRDPEVLPGSTSTDGVSENPAVEEPQGTFKPEPVAVPGEGQDDIKEEEVPTPTMTKIDIVAAHMEETGGDIEGLLAFLKKGGYPDSKKQDIYNIKYQLAKRGEAPNREAKVKPAAAESRVIARTPAATANSSSFAARFAAAIAKISEGLAELQALEPEASRTAELAERYQAAAKLFGAK